jgi:N-methylhydantoinase A
MVFLRQADLRHVGQGHEISLPLPFARMADVDLDSELRPYFYDFYAGIYGHAHRHLALELITCRLTASGPRPRVTLRDTGSQSLMADAAQKGERRAYFAELGGFVEVPVYDRERLSAGMSFLGPAIVEEKDSTAVIGPGAEVSVDRYANLRVTFVLDSGR